MATYRSIGLYETRADLITALGAFLVTQGWTDVGTTPGFVFQNVADSEGRVSVVGFAENGTYANLIDVTLGNDVSGDVVQDSGGASTQAGGLHWVSGQPFVFHATDRWFAAHMVCAATDYSYVMMGSLECELSAADYPSPQIWTAARAVGNTTRIVYLDRYGDSYRVRNAADDSWIYAGPHVPWFFYTTGAAIYPRTADCRINGAPGGRGLGYIAHRMYWSEYPSGGYMTGYLKDAWVVWIGTIAGTEELSFFRVQVGSRYYYHPGGRYEGYFGDYGALVLPGEDVV